MARMSAPSITLEARAVSSSKSDSSDGKHHLIPLDWVDHIDQHVHLSKSITDVHNEWTALN